MYILVNDKMQTSDAPNTIKSPALADVYEGALPFTVDFGSAELFNCVGIGYTDATEITFDDGTNIRTVPYTENGLYLIGDLNSQTIEIDHDGSYMGRIGMGEWRRLGLSPQREPGFYTTNQSRITASGQVIEGAGGFSGRKIGVDVRYKIDSTFYADFNTAYPGQLGKNYPVFVDLEKSSLYPFELFYGRFKNTDFVFQSSVNRFLYSRRFQLLEAF